MIFGYARVSTKDQSLDRNGGRKPGSYNKERAKASVALYLQKKHTIREILAITGIKSKATLYEYLRWEGVFE